MKRNVPLKRSGFKPAVFGAVRSDAVEPKPAPGPRKRKCAVKGCDVRFVPRSMLHKACGPEHAELIAKDVTAKQQRKADRERKQSLKSRKDWEREAQQAVNQWVREVRDADKPCISCGRWHDGQWHAGHYLSRGARPNLALVALNIAKQCMPCNVHLSGNQVQFRAGLVARIGVEAVEALEADHTPRKYTIDELKSIRDAYRKLLRDSKKGV